MRCSRASHTDVCEYDVANNRAVWEGSIAADYLDDTEAAADNEVVISFQTRLLNGVAYAENIADAYWDENGDDDVADDRQGGQSPVRTNDNAPVGAGRPLPIPLLPPVALALALLLAGLRGLRRVR